MEYKRVQDEVKIPNLGIGTYRMGEGRAAGTSNDNQDIEAIRLAIDLKMTHIDTAERYASGCSEEVIADAIEPYDRKDLFITTKVWHNHLNYEDLIVSMKGSLKRLRLDYVDLYLIHWPNPEVPLEETMGALEYCAKEGYTRYIGVSNFSAGLIEEAQSYLDEYKLVANQVNYSLLVQEPRANLLPYCIENDIILVAYTPLGRGTLAQSGNKVLDELAKKYEKTQAQISLNWLISQENVVAIPKASNLDHIRENAGAIGWNMNENEFQRLALAFNK